MAQPDPTADEASGAYQRAPLRTMPPADTFLTVASDRLHRQSAPIPCDFTARVMARIDAQTVPGIPGLSATLPVITRRTKLTVVASTLSFAVLLLVLSGILLVLLYPGIVFAMLGVVVDAVMLLLTALQALTNTLNRAAANTLVMLIVAATCGVSLALSSYLLRYTRRATHEA